MTMLIRTPTPPHRHRNTVALGIVKLRNPLLPLRAALPGLLVLCLAVSGCRHHHVQAAAPPPPPTEQAPPSPIPTEPAPETTSPVLHSEIGIASWYGAPYHNAHAANGQVYDEDGMTAAHRTLPMGTVVRVTNLSTRQSVVVTIADRGPFVPGRILDLSRAAARKIGVWRTGTARVRIDVLRYPPPPLSQDDGASRSAPSIIKGTPGVSSRNCSANIPAPTSSTSKAPPATGSASAPTASRTPPPNKSPASSNPSKARPTSSASTNFSN